MRRPAGDVVCVGLHCCDVLARTVPYLPTGQDQVIVEEIRWTVAGTAAATAVDLARLGVPVASVGTIGADAFGELLRATMAREGVDCHLVTVPDAQTSTAILPLSPSGDRPAIFVVGAMAALGPEHVPWDLVDGARVLHLGGSLLLPRLDGEPSADLLRRARARGVTTTLDFIPDDRPDMLERLLPALPHVDFLMPNLEEGMRVAGARSRQEAIDRYLGWGVGCVLLTMGADGVSVTPAGGTERVLPAFAVEPVDTTGCGDGFSAGFITGLLEGRDVAGAAELGLAAGSLVATGLGSDAGIVDRAGLDAFASRTPRRVPSRAAGDARA